MNYIKSIIIFILIGLFNPLYAINGDSPFQCDATPYMVIDRHSMLESMDLIDLSEHNITYVDAYDENVPIDKLRVNGIAYNILDNYIYGRVTTEYNTTSGNSEHNLSVGDIIRLEKDGNLTRIGHDLNGSNIYGNLLTSDLYKNSNVLAGTMDSQGRYYTINTKSLFVVNIEQNASQDSIKDENITKFPLQFWDNDDGEYQDATSNPSEIWGSEPADITFNVVDKKIYGLAKRKNDNNNSIYLYSMRKGKHSNGADRYIVDIVPTTGATMAGLAGGAWSTSNGTLYFYQNAENNSHLYKIDVSNTPAVVTEVTDNVNNNKFFDATACRPPYVTKKAQNRFVTADGNLTYTFQINNPHTKDIYVKFIDNLGVEFDKYFTNSLTSANGGTVSFTNSDKNLTIDNLKLPADSMVEFNITVKLGSNLAVDKNISNIAYISYGDTTLGSDDPVTADIDDGTIVTVAPTISIGDLSKSEGNSGTTNFNFDINLSDNIGTYGGSVDYYIVAKDTNSSDLNLSQVGTINFASGEKDKTITIEVNGDIDIENDEKFYVILRNEQNISLGDFNATGTILNDDLPQISIADMSANEGNSSTTNFDFNISMDRVSNQDVNVTYTTANEGDDLNSKTAIAIIPAGEKWVIVSIPVNGDTTVEANDTFNLNLTNPNGATILDNQATATILNDDIPQISIADISANEGNSSTINFDFNISIDKPSNLDINVTYATDNEGDDLAHKIGTVKIPAGQKWVIVSIPVNGDTTVEGDDTFNLNLTNPINATILDNQATATIVNDDIAVVTPPPPPPPPPANSVDANDDNITMKSNTQVAIDVLNNDIDADGDSFSINSFDTNSTNGGEISIDENNSLVYKPTKDFIGDDSFTYEIKDSNGNIDRATVKIEVTPMPIANDDNVTTSKNSEININVLDNDIDLTNNELNISKYTNPSNGTIILEDNNTITYIPDSDFVGEDSFIYTIIDINETQANASVYIIIEDSNSSDEDNTTTNIDDSNSSNEDNTTANIDDSNNSNEDNTTANIEDSNSSNEDNTTANIDDSSSSTDNNSSEILPQAIDDIVEGKRDEILTIPVLENDITNIGFDVTSLKLIDNNGNEVSYIDVPNEGEWIVEDNGTITFKPVPDFRGETTPVGYTVDETTGRSVTSTALIYISYPEVKDDIKEDDNATAGEDSIFVDIFTNDPIEDPILSTLQIIGTNNPLESLIVDGEGIWSIEGDKIIFTPENGFLGDPTPIKYIVENSAGEKTNPARVEVYYPIKARDNYASTTPNKAVELDILSDDNGNLDRDSIELVIPEELYGIAILSDDNKSMIVPNEGVWEVLGDGMVIFTPNAKLERSPTPIDYIVYKKNRTRVAGASIFIDLRAVGDVCDTTCGQSDSVSSYNILSMILIFIFTILFVKREENL
ncbi:probable aggregation factor core protein MAFp3, isoform C [hydrothermal vent metagenome]|uniref:Probable aggregation factor core protein MAFp3, isoform C n=1 Tax=hydrothermal vent metagenome TaxID=652676 RepID=A0A1W1EID5_9ZZZZ